MLLKGTSESPTENRINLLNHCPFCLRKTATKNEKKISDNYVRIVASCLPLEVTNQVTKHCLNRVGSGAWRDFEEPPTICTICAGDVRRVHQLLEDLAKAASVLQNVVEWAGREGRVREFLTELRTVAGDEELKRSTVKLLIQLGHLELQEEESKTEDAFTFDEIETPEVKKEEDLWEEPNEEFQDIDEASVPHLEDACDWGDDYVEDDSESDDDEVPEVSIKTKTNSSRSKKRKHVPDDDEYSEGVEGSSEGPLNKTSLKPVRPKKPSKRDRDREDCPRTTNGAKCMRCDFCREWVRVSDLHSHVRTHVGDFAIDCPNPSCPATYTATSSLKYHLNPKHSKTCSSFLSEANLDACLVCGFQATSQRSLCTHLMSIHEAETSTKEYHCPVSNCSEEFAHRQSVFSHINLKHRLKPDPSGEYPAYSSQRCPILSCTKNIPHGSMSQHLVDDHGTAVDSIVTCKHCPFVYLSHVKLLDHLPIHLRTGVAIGCDLCPGEEIKFAGIKELREHYYEVHQVGEVHHCEHCDKSSLDLSEIKHHMKRTHKIDRMGNRVNGVKCDLCPGHVTREYFHPTILLKHKINEHGAEPFRCEFCGKTFSLQRRCLEHELEHKGIAKPAPKQDPVMCDIPGCGKFFSTKKQMRKHQKRGLHTGKTGTELCGECGKAFSSNSSLKVHQKTQHATNKLRFVCDQCGTECTTKKGLQTHITNIHINPMVLNCHLCNRRFGQRRNLDRPLAHLKPDGTCLGKKNFRPDWRKRRQERLERERASQQLNT